MTIDLEIRLAKGKFFSLGHSYLFTNEIVPDNFLGNGMLNL